MTMIVIMIMMMMTYRYLHFTLYKENMETSEAIAHLANKCRTNEKYFGFAGTKDRRGRTVQRVSVSNQQPITAQYCTN